MGHIWNKNFGINKIIGSTILSSICFLVFLKNIDKMVKINVIIIPILIIIMFIIGFLNIFSININFLGSNTIVDTSVIWLLSSLKYSGYNLILLIPVLINLNHFINGKKHIVFISLITSLILTIIAILIFLLLVNVNIDFSNLEMPILYVVNQKFSSFIFLYGLIILIAIFTTSISIGISFLNNIENKKSYTQFAWIMCITSVVISNFGFSNLVENFYSIFGYIGILQIMLVFFFSI